MTRKVMVLTGLDGMNPLGFMAAVGLMRVLDRCTGHDGACRLAWQNDGRWTPRLEIPDGLDPVAEVASHAEECKEPPELSLEYKGKHDLKPPPEDFVAFQAAALDRAESRLAETGTPDRTWVDFVAAYAPGVATDGKGMTKPTAFHFTAGQQLFLDAVRKLADGLTEKDVRTALFGPWDYSSPLPTLRWDALAERSHALLGFDPSKDKVKGNPGADWLAFQALPLFPTVPRPVPGHAPRVGTTGFQRDHDGEWFTWPLWRPMAGLGAARSLLARGRFGQLRPGERTALGVSIVLRSQVRRTGQGYGSFTPAQVVPPRVTRAGR